MRPAGARPRAPVHPARPPAQAANAERLTHLKDAYADKTVSRRPHPALGCRGASPIALPNDP